MNRTECEPRRDAFSLSCPVFSPVFQGIHEDLLPCRQELLQSGKVLRGRTSKWPGVPFLMLPVDEYPGVFFDP